MNAAICSGAGKKYMVLQGGAKIVGHEREMLKENQIDALLPFYTVERNGELEYWYDVTGKKSVEEVFEENGVNLNLLAKVFEYTYEALCVISKYLIAERNILFKCNTMYFSDKRIELCFFPREEEEETPFLDLGEYLITKVDPNLELVSRMCYEIYSAVSSPGFDCNQMANRILEEIESEKVKFEEKIDDYYKGIDFEDKIVSSVEEDDGEQMLPVQKKSVIERLKGKFDEEVSLAKDVVNDFLPGRKKEFSSGDERMIGRLIYDGSEKEEDYCVDKEVFKVGCDAKANDACLHSDLISKHHSKIQRKNGKFYLSDWNSKKGTYYNGRRLRRGEVVELSPLDRIAFADVPYRWA
ncbi:MAG: FHA domain-containing protein [Lachnospiraceae bacterium]|nr:FHA domain-containing protein [Lachnospiraceae bacterium]